MLLRIIHLGEAIEETNMDRMKRELVDSARAWGADLVAVADTERLAGIETQPTDLLEGFPRAISIAVHLADGIMDAIVDRPTTLYSQHYQRVNALLDDIATRVYGLLQARGARALPIPASQILCEERFTSYLSHKAVAVAAGLGWQGKSLLVVTPQYGPRVRLVTVLTDMELPADAPLRNRCASCDFCTEACPAGAIKGVNTDSHYDTREEAVDLAACVAQTRRHAEAPHIAPYICGVCVAVCPWGRKRRGKAAASAA